MYCHQPMIVGIGHHPQAQLAGLHSCLPHADSASLRGVPDPLALGGGGWLGSAR